MLSILTSLLIPNIAYADDIDTFISKVNKVIVNPLILLLFGLALMYFLWGLFNFISNQDNEDERTSGKMHMMYGIIGMTIMMSVFAIMQIILNTFNVTDVNIKTGTVQLDTYDRQIP